jgi:hypothetical protein
MTFRSLFYRDLTQTEACAKLREHTADLAGPVPTRDQHGRDRIGWNVSDGREDMTPKTRWQRAADRILKRA